METRIDWPAAAPGGLEAMLGLARHVRESGLEPGLLELVKLRASQINGCAYCIDMHTKDARAAGESDQRLYEALTRLADAGVPDELFERAHRQFSEAELVELTLATVLINGWDRLAVAFRPAVGSYQPGSHEPASEEAGAGV